MFSKNQQKICEDTGMPSLNTVPTQVTLTGNVGSLDTPRASQLFTFGRRGLGIALNCLKNQQKILEASGMQNMPTVPTQQKIGEANCMLLTIYIRP